MNSVRRWPPHPPSACPKWWKGCAPMPGATGGARRAALAVLVHQRTVADRRRQGRPGQRLPHHGDRQIRRRHFHAMTGTEIPAAEGAAIVAQGALVLGRAVQIIEHHGGQPRAPHPAQIGDIDGPFQLPHAPDYGVGRETGKAGCFRRFPCAVPRRTGSDQISGINSLRRELLLASCLWRHRLPARGLRGQA